MPKPRFATDTPSLPRPGNPPPPAGQRMRKLEQALETAQNAAAAATAQLAAHIAREARQARQAALASASAREKLLTSLNHEIRTPLNGVLGLAVHLANTPLDSHQRQMVEIIADTGQHLLEVLDDVLGAATGQHTPAPAGTPRPGLALPPPYDTGRLRGARVLLVEDNAINRDVARPLFGPWGAVLHEAVDGPAALARLNDHTYDVVLMDIQLPGLSGLDVTRALRGHPDPHRAAVPVIALTANATTSDKQRYLAAGLTDCLAKPFDEAELYRKIVAVLPAARPRLAEGSRAA